MSLCRYKRMRKFSKHIFCFAGVPMTMQKAVSVGTLILHMLHYSSTIIAGFLSGEPACD